MNTLNGEWTQCKDCIYFDDCTTKESDDGCYFGNTIEKKDIIKMSDTINIEKYINALNNLLGSDNAYYMGDSDVDTIVEAISTVKELGNKVSVLTKENDRLKADCDNYIKLIEVLNKNNAELEAELSNAYDLLEEARPSSIYKVQEKDGK